MGPINGGNLSLGIKKRKNQPEYKGELVGL